MKVLRKGNQLEIAMKHLLDVLKRYAALSQRGTEAETVVEVVLLEAQTLAGDESYESPVAVLVGMMVWLVAAEGQAVEMAYASFVCCRRKGRGVLG
jgi:hypothetical protein